MVRLSGRHTAEVPVFAVLNTVNNDKFCSQLKQRGYPDRCTARNGILERSANGPDVNFLAQISGMGSIPIARSISLDDSIAFMRLSR